MRGGHDSVLACFSLLSIMNGVCLLDALSCVCARAAYVVTGDFCFASLSASSLATNQEVGGAVASDQKISKGLRNLIMFLCPTPSPLNIANALTSKHPMNSFLISPPLHFPQNLSGWPGSVRLRFGVERFDQFRF